MPKGHGRPFNKKERALAARGKGILGFLLEQAGPASASKTSDRETGSRSVELNILRNISHAMGGTATRSSGNMGPKEARKRKKRRKTLAEGD